MRAPRLPGFDVSIGLTPVTKNWFLVRDGDNDARELFDNHYSRHHYKDGRRPKLFCGPGFKIVLITGDGRAMFVWRKFIDASGQQGVNCAVFRNEGNILSSALILEAESVAMSRFPNERMYTYVKTSAVRGDGCCFKKAGWKKCGRTKANNLLILEKTVQHNNQQKETE